MDLPVLRYGDGSRRALLLHGITSNADGWWRVGPAIAEWGYSVIAPDLRGHGRAGPADRYRLSDHAADVAALGDRWDLVLGHSMGAAIALLLDRPIDRLVLEDPALVVPDTPETRAWLTAAYESPPTTDAVAAANPTWHLEDARIKAEALAQSTRDMVEQTMTDNPDWNVMERLLQIDTPTLIVGGDPQHGGLVPPELGRSIAAQVPAVEYVMIPGSSHSIHRDEFDRFMATVRDWLDA